MEPTFMDLFYFTMIPALGEALAIFLGVFLGVMLASKRVLTGIQDRSATDDKDALEIVQERYARGEISRREYEQMREDLQPEASETTRSEIHPNRA